jgi:hypothetical protein
MRTVWLVKPRVDHLRSGRGPVVAAAGAGAGAPLGGVADGAEELDAPGSGPCRHPMLGSLGLGE